MTPKVEARQDEVALYHRKAMIPVLSMMWFVVAVTALVWTGVIAFEPRSPDPTLIWALRISIVVFGLGAITLRRTRFSAARLQDIASLRGETGLLATLQQTTFVTGAIGEAIAIIGLIITSMTGDKFDILRAAVIALAVLLYVYPRRAAWEREVELTRQNNGAVNKGATAKGTLT